MMRIYITGILMSVFLSSCDNAGNKNVSHSDLLPVAEEMQSLLLENMMPAWYPRVIDQEYGGYLSNFSYKWDQTGSQDKMIVTQARHVWTCSKMYAFTGDTVYLGYAKHGYQFLKNFMWDKTNGGFYNLVTREGQPINESGGPTIEKNAYGNAFAIYALAAYYKESDDPEALNLARQAFSWLEKNSHDETYGGYFMFLDEDGTPFKEGIRNIPPKDQNSSIHIMEALTELYEVWPDELVRKRLNEMLMLIRDDIVQDRGNLQLYLNRDLTPVSLRDSSKEFYRKNYFLDHISFGHDVETAYLLMESSEVLKIRNDKKTRSISKKMVDNALTNGWDNKSAGVFDAGYFYRNEDTITILRDSKNWWAQAETMNTLLIMSDLYPDDRHEYRKKFLAQWQFIKDYLVDWENGGWYEGSLDKEPRWKMARKAQIWKGNYHTTRSLLNCIHRIKSETQD
jgi:mannobiose 2-epimerase